MHLALCIVSARDWKPHFGISLVHMVATLPNLRGKVKTFAVMPRPHCSAVAKGRRLVIGDAIEGGFTHALCIDDDMMFPPEALEVMIDRGKPFVAANYLGKHGTNTAIVLSDKDLECDTPVSSKGKTGIEEVHRVGFGLVLFELEPVRAMRQPIFTMPWIVERETELGEDYYFCLQWRKTGNGIWVDHDVSNKVQHITDTGLETH